MSCTFGAGGSTLSYTSETVRHLKQSHGFDAAPHLSCVGGSREEIRELLKLYKAIGCRRIVALRGDLPSGMGHPGDLRYASELIEFIRREHGDAFHIEVGAYPETHPQSEDALTDLKHFKAKVDAGANGAITQYFTTPTLFPLRRRGSQARWRSRSSPESCPSPTHPLKRFSRSVRRRDPTLDRQAHEALGTMQKLREFVRTGGRLCDRLLAGGAPSLSFFIL